jgi:hypothetical protein
MPFFTDHIYTSFNLPKPFYAKQNLSAFTQPAYRRSGMCARLRKNFGHSNGQKQVLKGKGTVRLNLRDPFARQRFRGYTKLDGIDMTFDNRPTFASLRPPLPIALVKPRSKTSRAAAPRVRRKSKTAWDKGVKNFLFFSCALRPPFPGRLFLY